MKNKILLSLMTLGLAISPVFVFAEESESAGNVSSISPKGIRPAARNEIKEIRKEAQDAKKEIRTKAKEDIKNTRTENKEKILEQKNNIHDLRKNLQEKRLETKNAIEQKRETLKNDLAKIKDQRKTQTVVKIDGNLEKINETRTNNLMDSLSKIEQVLQKVIDRTAKLESSGQDVSAVKTAIENAKIAIATGKTAIGDQSAKVYKITITEENKLKTDVSSAVKSLQGDIVLAREAVRKAHEAVKTAIASLNQSSSSASSQ